MNIKKNYSYRYETHLHTKEGSACGRASGKEMARAYKASGYTGIIVTDHFFYGNTAVDRTLSWNSWVDKYCKGYEMAKEEGDKIGLQVFFGWEATYDGTDFLVYGLDKEWLIDHPEIKDATIEEQYKLVKADGGIVIHAHPYREAYYIPKIRLFPEYVDGVEVVNASHALHMGTPGELTPYDSKALAYAEKYNFPQISGSDIHSTQMLGGGMAFSRRLKDIHDFADAVIKKEGELLY